MLRVALKCVELNLPLAIDSLFSSLANQALPTAVGATGRLFGCTPFMRSFPPQLETISMTPPVDSPDPKPCAEPDLQSIWVNSKRWNNVG